MNTEGTPDFIPDFFGDMSAITHYDKDEEGYQQDSATLRELIDKGGWPEGWLRPGMRVFNKDSDSIHILDDAVLPLNSMSYYPLPCDALVGVLVKQCSPFGKYVEIAYYFDCFRILLGNVNSGACETYRGDTLIGALLRAWGSLAAGDNASLKAKNGVKRRGNPDELIKFLRQSGELPKED